MWYGGHAEVPSVFTFSSTKDIRDFSLRSALVCWKRSVLLAEPPVGGAAALGHEEELVVVALCLREVDLNGQVGLGVVLLEHVLRRDLRVAEVGAGLGIVDAPRDVRFIVAVCEDMRAAFCNAYASACVLTGRQHHSSCHVGVFQELKRDKLVVLRRFLVLQDEETHFITGEYDIK